MNRIYLFSIGYFTLMSFFLVSSGIWIFIEKIGLDAPSILNYYAGNEQIPAKSIYGQLEIAVAHFGAIGMFIMVLLHFYIFIPHNKRSSSIGAISLFVFGFINIISGIVISNGIKEFAIVKLIAFSIFSILSFIAIAVLFVAVIKDLIYQNQT